MKKKNLIEKIISKNYLRGRKFLWGVFKGARGGGLGMGRFKRGADLEHNRIACSLRSPIVKWRTCRMSERIPMRLKVQKVESQKTQKIYLQSEVNHQKKNVLHFCTVKSQLG